tara:strand:- start:178 stop:504 length:327 start_codon:yes stop_codon:yes gene_type:complete
VSNQEAAASIDNASQFTQYKPKHTSPCVKRPSATPEASSLMHEIMKDKNLFDLAKLICNPKTSLFENGLLDANDSLVNQVRGVKTCQTQTKSMMNPIKKPFVRKIVWD